MERYTFTCPSCFESYKVTVDYLDMSGDWRLRCNSCPNHVKLSAYHDNLANILSHHVFVGIFNPKKEQRKVEKQLLSCPCGGNFCIDSLSRCYSCYSCYSCNCEIGYDVITGQLKEIGVLPNPRMFYMSDFEYSSDHLWKKDIKACPKTVWGIKIILGSFLFLAWTITKDIWDGKKKM